MRFPVIVLGIKPRNGVTVTFVVGHKDATGNLLENTSLTVSERKAGWGREG